MKKKEIGQGEHASPVSPLDPPMSIEVHEKVLAMIKDIAYCFSKFNASPAEL